MNPGETRNIHSLNDLRVLVEELCYHYDEEIVYVYGKVRFTEVTLTDGSKVHNLELEGLR